MPHRRFPFRGAVSGACSQQASSPPECIHLRFVPAATITRRLLGGGLTEQIDEAATMKSSASARRGSIVARVLFWLGCAALGLDYQLRVGIGSTVPQQIIVAAGTGLTIAGLLCTRIAPWRTSAKGPFLLSLLYLATASLCGWVNGAPPYELLRVATPFILFAVGIGAGAAFVERCDRHDVVLAPLLLSGIISTVWRPYVATHLLAMPVLRLRHQIVGGLAGLLLAVAAAWLVLGRRRSFAVAIGVVAGTSILLSATRALMLALLTLVGASALWVIHLYGWHRAKPRFLQLASLGAVALVMVVAAGILLREDALARLQQRFGESSNVAEGDITLLAREMEYSGAWHRLVSEPTSALFGAGFGAPFYGDNKYSIPLVRYQAPIFGQFYNVAHSFWLGSLYHGGVAFGWIMPWILCAACLRSWRIVRAPTKKSPRDLIALVTSLFLIYCVGTSFTSSPMTDRLLAFGVGAVIGAVYASSPWPAPREVVRADRESSGR